MAQKVVSGHRARVSIVDPTTGVARVIGIFSSVSWAVNYGAQDIPILGRTSVGTIQYTHAEPVSFRLTAWHALDHGPYVDAAFPKLQTLLQNPTTVITVLDRQLEADGRDGNIASITDCVITGMDSALNAQRAQEFTITGRGIFHSDESAQNAEAAGATALP